MTKYFCDKCDRELSDFEIFNVEISTPSIRIFASENSNSRWQICQKCEKELVGWMNTKVLIRKKNKEE